MKPTYQGEMQFRRYSDTSTQGAQVVFCVPDREALDAFIGREGKRFMAVFVEIGDDEQPVDPSPPRTGWNGVGPKCREAVDLAANPAFARFLLHMGESDSPEDSIRRAARITSRKELDSDEAAYQRFVKYVREPFQRYVRERFGRG